ncbi:MAG: RusA family crossover junction endodeoxyribonuclease [Candidatus Anammoxibacter sp.]
MHYDITPVAKPRMTQRDKWKKRPCVLHYHAFKDECRLKRVEIPQPCKIAFCVPMPKSWSEKKRSEMNHTPHTQTPDIDNMLKALFDAVCEEDSHIWNVWAVKIWAEEGSISIVKMK